MISRYGISPQPGLEIIEIDTVSSTNDFARANAAHLQERLTVVVAEFQEQGRGATGGWESERGKNLVFSLLSHPTTLPPAQMFRLSVAACLAVCRALSRFAPGCEIKWPNDVYHGDGKLAGILIENELRGKVISDCVVGIGVNVNQRQFHPDAPNPLSLAQLVGHELDRSAVLSGIIGEFGTLLDAVQGAAWEGIFAEYKALLYRREGQHSFTDAQGTFQATLQEVEPDGHLVLRDSEGGIRRYAFKEVSYNV